MSEIFSIEGTIDVDRLAKYIRIDLEQAEELDVTVPCAACGLIEEIGTGPAMPASIRECQESNSTICPLMGGEKGSYNMAWWFLRLAEMASKPVEEVAHIKCERYEDYPEEEASDGR